MIKKIFDTKKDVSPLQMSLTLLLVMNLILSNILVLKPINLFGFEWLPNTMAAITFPVTYILSDIFSEVYGYRWSRLSALWALIGTGMASLYFAIMIAVPGNQTWTDQAELVKVLGSTPSITIASIAAFYIGDLVNDKVFRSIRNKLPQKKFFGLRAMGSSIAGKYVDSVVFTFIGLHFLPLKVKLLMILTGPIINLALETVLLPATTKLAWTIEKAESKIQLERSGKLST